MYANTCHGGLRTKPCLPAKLHSKIAHRLYPEISSTHSCVESSRSIPKSRQTIVIAPKRANSRFFTDCYPISAVFRPKVNQTRPRKGAVMVRSSDHETCN